MGAQVSGDTAPGPRLGLVNALFENREPADQLDLLLRAAREYGPVVRISVANRFLHLLDDPGTSATSCRATRATTASP